MTIYFDLDGVLVDFVGGLDEHNIPTDDKMWDGVKAIPHFYSCLKPKPLMVAMFKMLSKTYNCEVLTALPKPERGINSAEQDKRDWVSKHLGSDVKVHTCLRRDKVKLCTGPTDILIDDLEDNIRNWEAAGGVGIHHISTAKTNEALHCVLS